jgi:hypothetical protein
MLKALAAMLLSSSALVFALSPTPEAQRAFDRYTAQAEQQMRSGAFLYADTHGAAREQARKGGTFVVELRDAGVPVPDGAVHDWLGVAFFPNTDVARVRAILADYADYARIYAPDVSAARTLEHSGDRYRIELQLENKQFLTLHYDSEYAVSYAAPAAGRLEVVSRSTRIAQQGEDDGFLWRLNSYWRFEQADGGVYAECRSRAVPFGFGWLRGALEKFPRDSMVRTMEATKRAAAR